jgi:hypothetical protein
VSAGSASATKHQFQTGKLVNIADDARLY